MRAVWCLFAAGCGFTHGSLQDMAPKDGPPQDDATRTDAALGDDAAVDGSPSLCGSVTPRLVETFDQAPACPLGVSGGNATMVLSQNTLQISTNTNGQNSYCNEPNLGSWSGNGATIEVPSVMTGNNAWTSFQVLGPNFAITEKNGFLVFSDNTGASQYALITYSATLMRWWRMRPDATGDNVIAEYSADRVLWTTLGTHSGGGTIRVQMIAGTDGTASPSGVSRYDNLVVCP